jgi:hypothetical protein
MRHAYQLGLGRRRTLEMQASYCADRVRQRLVGLYEGDLSPRCVGEPPGIEGHDEIAAVIAEALGAEQQYLGNAQTLDLHGLSTVALDAPVDCRSGAGGQKRSKRWPARP